MDNRARLGDTIGVENLSPEDLLAQYWRTIDMDSAEMEEMQRLAKEVFVDVDGV
jgi:hypothetical protein